MASGDGCAQTKHQPDPFQELYSAYPIHGEFPSLAAYHEQGKGRDILFTVCAPIPSRVSNR
jgi:hypothetical protein